MNNQETARTIYNNLENFFTVLYGRWQDEQGLEPFAGYAAVMAKEIEKLGGEFVKGTKRPFGAHFNVGPNQYKIYISNSTYTYKRIG